MPNLPFIPETITVHLGAPDEYAANVTVSFPEYIANVASSEIYPTWPESAIRANIYAQISFALNRIYTEYYRTRGYGFDITNSTAIDQSFVNGRDIFENVQQIVDEIFTDYIQRQGNVEPLLAQYCNGTTVTCPGLSQWGTVELANRGYSPYEILTYYYGDDINIVTDTPVAGITASVPDRLLRVGVAGDDVRTIQIRLNRIANNYPAIPKIAAPDGIFSYDTEAAVTEFQRIFGLTPDGIVGKATWYRIQLIYNSVKRLNELDSEGITLSEVTQQFPGTLALGDTGNGVANLQYYLSFLSRYYNTIPPVSIDGIFGELTEQSVIGAQNTFGLTPDGVVGTATFDAIYNAYLGIVETIPIRYTEGVILPFPGVTLRLGVEAPEVNVLQEYINYIADTYPQVVPVSVTGYFGSMTEAAVRELQEILGIPSSGIVGAVTWNAIAELYRDLFLGNQLQDGQYPGNELGA